MNEDFTDFIETSGLVSYDPDTISKIYQKSFQDIFGIKIMDMELKNTY